MPLSQSAEARVTGIGVAYKNFNTTGGNFLRQRLAVVGQGSSAVTYSTDPYLVNSSGDVATRFGFGSPVHLASRALFPANNDGIGGIPVTIYPLVDDGAGVPADGSIDCAGTSTEQATGSVKIGGITSALFTIPSGTTEDAALALVKTAIDSVLQMPVLTGVVAAGALPLNAKWDGETGNEITLDVTGITAAGLTFSTTVMASGAANPDVDDALNKIVNIWETMVLNCLNYSDVTNLTKYQNWGEGRWNNQVKKPVVVASGCVDDFATRTAISDARKDDRINGYITSTGSPELPWVIAARGLAIDIMPTANGDFNNSPAQNYKGKLTQYEAGADTAQETYTERNNALKLGASSNIKTGNVAELSNIITFYHPDGETIKPYRYFVDIVRLQNIVYNCELIFASDDWKGAPLVPDTEITDIAGVRKPKDGIAALRILADFLSRKAIISDLQITLDGITANIDGSNPKRLNWTFPVKLSGNTEVISGDVLFGFFLGQ